MRCPILVGRDELAAQLAGAVATLSGRGAGQTLVLLGERASARAGWPLT